MGRSGGIFYVGTSGVIAVFIAELAIEHQYLLTQFVRVLGKVTSREVANDGGCASDFITPAVQHASLYAGHRTGGPAQRLLMYDDSLTVIRMYLHWCHCLWGCFVYDFGLKNP
jgi:hypothetical protein